MSIISELQSDHQDLPSVYSHFGMRMVTSTSLSRVFEIGRQGFFILSAFRPDYEVGDRVNYKRARDAGMKEKPHLQNFERYQKLQQRLIHFNIGYVSLVGQWRDNPDDPVHEELSVFVPYKNRKGAIFADNIFEFQELPMLLASEFDQTAFVYCPPDQDQNFPVKVYTVYTGLNQSSDRSPSKGDKDLIGNFHVANVEDQYLSILMRANKSNRVPWKFEETQDLEPADPLEVASSKSFPMTVGIQWRQMEWAGASIYSKGELLWMLDREEQAQKLRDSKKTS